MTESLADRIDDLASHGSITSGTAKQIAIEVRALEARCRELRDKIMEAVGWAYADCCSELDKGGDPRQTDMAGVVERVTVDLALQKESTTANKTDIAEAIKEQK